MSIQEAKKGLLFYQLLENAMQVELLLTENGYKVDLQHHSLIQVDTQFS
jgi:hypothetical protein